MIDQYKYERYSVCINRELRLEKHYRSLIRPVFLLKIRDIHSLRTNEYHPNLKDFVNENNGSVAFSRGRRYIVIFWSYCQITGTPSFF